MKYLPRKDVLFRQLAISGIPLALAITYAIFGYYAETEEKRSITVIINYFAAGFFFLMWLVSQYLRTAKQIDDSSQYEQLQAGLSDVKNSINQLHELHKQKSEDAGTSNALLQNAQDAITSGFVLPGLMQAGVAFEQAVINKAQSRGLYTGPKMPVSKVINNLRRIYDEGVINELFAVWKLRNQLVHLSPEAAEELANQPELFKYFQWAVSELEK